MINVLMIDMEVVLPSGNRVVLLMPDGADWVCRYTEFSRARGEVVFAALFLRRWARRA
jgi:hypothetical protein